MERNTHTIDATGKVLGRLASQIAILLRGKHKPGFVPYKDEGDFVTVKNASKLIVNKKRIEQKKYFRHSGYPGGLKERSLKKLFADRPEEVLRNSVLGMLAKNKLRSRMIRRLRIDR